MMTASVTLVEAYRWWLESDLDWDWFVANRLVSTPTWAMKAGSALHKALEDARPGEFDALSAEGFTFSFENDYEESIPLGTSSEVPCQKAYGPLTIRGRCDSVAGNLVRDVKLRIGSVDAAKVEGYFDSYQWRFYLDMMGANVFEYLVFEAIETSDPYIYVVRQIHKVRQYRYLDLEKDCFSLADKYSQAAETKPELVKQA